jgi:hypothetical protein
MLKIGQKVRLIKNPLDEQLGEFIPIGIKVITDTKDVSKIKGTSGQWARNRVVIDSELPEGFQELIFDLVE